MYLRQSIANLQC
jgi:YD repeat-containing protein